MITKFWGRNVGLLKEFSVDLGPMTFLVGKNAAGKSTFLRGLRCLAMLTRLPILGERGALPLGYRATIRELFGGEEMVLGVHVETERGAGEYEVTLGTDGPLVLVVGEKVEWKGTNGKSFGYGQGGPEFYYMHRGNYLSSKLPRATSLPYFCFPIYKGKQHEEVAKLAPLYELMDQFTPFHVYRFSPSEIARPAEPGSLLAHDGAGLAAELDTLLGMDRSAFDRISSALSDLFPHIKQVNVSTLTERKSNVSGERGTARSVALKGLVFERHDGKAVTAEMESDGVLLTLAHLFLATRHVSPAVGIEEPETATYPSLLESRLRLFRTMSEGKAGTPLSQILVTTHSPTLLTMAQDPSLVRIFEHQSNGDVKIFTPPEHSMMEVIEKRLGWSVGMAD
ncbi:AAA family ATPase [Candidatus Binatus sp.]|uniref:AAA family ATPase n=1 Tax=Candidatus Binatus sp. TaxID=2811406 RepID=UPI003C7277E6